MPKITSRPPEGFGAIPAAKAMRSKVAARHRGWKPPRSGRIKATRPGITWQFSGHTGLTYSRLAAPAGDLGWSGVRLQTTSDYISPVPVPHRGGFGGILAPGITSAEAGQNSRPVDSPPPKKKILKILAAGADK